MKRILCTTAFVLGAAISGCTDKNVDAREAPRGSPDEGSLTKNAVTLRENMRKLWTDHVVWTREYIVAAVANDAGAKSAAARLMKNQEQIGSAVGSYYGGAAGDSVTALLKSHITIAVDLVAAAKAGNNAKVDEADKRWHDNAEAIATYLAAANPNWSKGDLQNMLNEHLSLTTQEAKDRIGKNWDSAIDTFDKILDQALHMADALSDGIMKQFPAKA